MVITNQAGIGRCFYTEQEFHSFVAWMNDRLGNLIDDYYFCPFYTDRDTENISVILMTESLILAC